MAPERFESDLKYDAATDIWSAGITILELLNGSYPYPTFTDIFTAKQTI